MCSGTVTGEVKLLSSAGPLTPRQPVDIDAVVAELRAITNGTALELSLRVGKLIINRFYRGDLSRWRSRGPKQASFRTLARRPDLPMSAAALYRSVALYELVVNLGGLEQWQSVGPTHLRTVLSLSQCEQKRLLGCVQKERWTVERLESEVRASKQRGPLKVGRPPLPRVVKALRRVTKRVREEADAITSGPAETLRAADLVELRRGLALARERLDSIEQHLSRVVADVDD